MNIDYLCFIKSFIVLTLQNSIKNEKFPYDINVLRQIMANYKINILLQYYFSIFFNLYSSPLSSSLNNLSEIMAEWCMNEYNSYLYADSATAALLIPFKSMEDYIDSLMNRFVNFHIQTPNDYHLSQLELTEQSPFVVKQYEHTQKINIMRNAIVYSMLNHKIAELDTAAFYQYYESINSNIKKIIENREECNSLPSKLQYEIYSIQMIMDFIETTKKT
jgi:hypothetical protein